MTAQACNPRTRVVGGLVQGQFLIKYEASLGYTLSYP